jgi:hypothetical protein
VFLESLEDRTLPSSSIPLSATAWTAVGPAPITRGQTMGPTSGAVAGRITGIAADQTNASTIYIAAAGGGVWKTTNGGTNWTPLTDTQATLFMGAVAVAPSNNQVIYAGTGESSLSGDSYLGQGVLKSTNAGASWTPEAQTQLAQAAISKIVVDPTNASVAYVAACVSPVNGLLQNNVGVWKTTDGGSTWTNTMSGLSNLSTSEDAVSDLIIDPNNSQTLYAGIWSPYNVSTSGGVYKTTNGGSSWTRLLGGLSSGNVVGRVQLAAAKTSQTTLYVSMAGTGQTGSTGYGALFKFMSSTNAGSSWTDLTADTPNYFGFGQGWYDSSLAVDPNSSSTVYVGGSYNGGSPGIMESTTGGTSWTEIGSKGTAGTGVHSDSHAMTFDANGKLLEGDDGGIFRLDNNSIANNASSILWTDLNGNLQITQFESIALHPTNPNIAFGASQDNGTEEFNDNLGWTLPRGGDGGYVAVDQTNPNNLYHDYSYTTSGFFERSTNGGATWSTATTGINTSDPANFYPPIEMDPSNSSTLLLGTDHVYETTNGAASWSQVGTFTFPANSNGVDYIDAVAIAPSSSSTMYAISAGHFYATTNASTWTQEADPITGSPVTSTYLTLRSIFVDPNNAQTVYVSADNPKDYTGGPRILKSTNGGASWTNITGNLPDGGVPAIYVDTRTNVIYAGTDYGIYSSNNGGSTWAPVETGFPNARVVSLALNTQDNILAAGTHGRGMWELATAHLKVTTSVSSVPAGTALSVTVTALDPFGATIPNYSGTIHFTSSDGSAALPADYAFVPGDSGSHTFTGVVFETTGTQTITATDKINSGVTGNASVTVTAAVATQFGITAPTSSPAGAAFSVTVTAEDSAGHPVAGYTGTIHFTSSDGTANLPANYTFTAADNGSHTFTGVILNSGGSQTVTATDTVSSSVKGSASITVTTAQIFQVTATSPETAGAAFNVTVAAVDSSGRVVPDYSGTVHFTSTDVKAVLPSDYTFVSGDHGQRTFSVTLKTAGSETVTVTDKVQTSITGNVSATVNPASTSVLVVASFPSPDTAGTAQNFTVTADDAFGNLVTGYTGTVHFTSSDTKAGLPGNYTFTATDAGQHTFSATLETAGTQSLTATDTVTGSITGSQTGITVNPAGASTLVVAGFPSPTTAGTVQNFTVTADDAFGNVATGYTGTVHFTSSDAKGGLPGNYTFTATDAGQHTFSATLETAGTQLLTATDTVTGSINGSQTGITVNPAGASTLVVAGFPSPTTAGTAQNFTVTADDAFGNVATGYTGTVHFTSSDAKAVLPGNYTFTAADAGQHTFSATLKTAGSQSLTATDTVTGSITGSQTGITINPAGASTLAVASFPSPDTAGTAQNFTVTADDAFGNVATGYTGTVHFTSSDAKAALPGNYTFTATDAGQHTFSATLKTAGTQSLTATDTVTGSITGSQTGITVNPAGASTLVVAGFLSPTTAGTAQSFTVTADDAFGNVATGYTGTAHFTSSDAKAVLPGNYTFTATDAGQHTFSATLKTAGSQSLTATDTVTGSITGSQTGITVNPASANTLVVAGFPSPTTAGTAQNFTVTVDDAFGNVATGYTGTLHFTSSDAKAGLPGNYTFTATDAGQHTFSATLKTAGSQSLTATDTVTGSITGSQTGIAVNPAGASNFAVAGFPSPTTAGTAQNFTVTADDAFGNVATGYTGTVHFTSSDAKAVLPGNYTFTASDAGQHTFSATFKTTGTQSLTVTDTVTGSITGNQTGIAVNPAAASTLVVAGFPSPPTAGTAQNVTVTADDAFGNIATGYTGTIHFTSSDVKAVLPGNYTFTAADAGQHTFSATLKTAGTQSLTATDTVTGSITGSQTGINVNPAGASTLVVAGFPSPTTAGTTQNFTVTADDAFGNVATGYPGTVHFTSSDNKAVLPGNYTFTPADAGQHTFSATLKTAGTQSLTATDTVTGSITGSQTGISVNPAAASTLVVANFASPTTAGTAQNFTATADDAFGNIVTGYTGTVHFTSSDAKAVLPGNYTFTASDAGQHTFSATLKTAGTQSLTATDTVTGSITGSQTGITVNPAAASTLVVAGFPSPTTAGTAQNFTVTADDAFDNVATGYTGTVHFTSSDTKAVLPGNYTFTASDAGHHTLSATLKTAGSQSVTATDTVTGSITGSETGITINPAGASTLSVAGFPSPTIAGTAQNFTVTADDAFGNVANGYAGTVHFTSSDAKAVLPGNYTFTGADAGQHTFSATLKTAGAQSLTVTDTVTGSITGSQTGITVNPAAASTLVVTGFPSPTTAGTAQNLTVTADDAFGNVANGYTGTVHFTSSDGKAVLPGNYTFSAADAGQHTFSAILKTAGAQSLAATDTVTGSIAGSQTGITVNPAAASTLVVAGFPSPTTAGAAQNFTVTANDAFGNVATGYTGTVHFTSSDNKAVLPANYTFTPGDAGQHTFSATLKTAGAQSLTATDALTGSIAGSQTGITVNPAAASTLVVAGFPSPTTAGASHNFTVTANDAFGNIASGYRGTVHFSSSDTKAALPANYTFTAGDAGQHTFSATLKTAGAQSLTAKDTVTGSITGSQTGITVNAAVASTLVVAGFPSPTTAGTAQNFTVTANDAFGNLAKGYTGTVQFTSSDTKAVLPGNYTFAAGDAGQHTFSATLKSAGTQSLTAKDTVTSSITGSQAGIAINPAAASTLGVAGFASPTTAGTAQNFTVTANDPFGNIATGYTGTIHFTSSDLQAVLPVNYTFTAGDGGQHTFSATLKTAGTQSLTATDTVTGSIMGSQAGISVTPAGASTLVVAGFASPDTAGTAQNFTVTADDAFGNVATGYTGTVQFGSSDAKAGLPGNYTFTASDAGQHTFSATLKTAGNQTLTATDTVSGSITGSQTGITVNPAGASTLIVAGFASPTVAGTAQNFTVTADDPFGNVATGYSGTVSFTSSDAKAVLPGNYAFTASDAGQHTFSATLKTAGAQGLTATDTVTGSTTGNQTGIVVNPGGASTMIVAGFSSPTTAGTAQSFTVTADDAFGNTATGYTGTIQFTSSDAKAVLPGNYTFTVTDAGQHTFSATLKTESIQSLTATDTLTGSIAGSQTGINVNAAATSSFIVAGWPSPATAGTAQTVTVTAQDAFGNVTPGYTGTVQVTSSDPKAVLPGAYTFTAGDAGVHSFSVTLETAGSQSITVTDTTTGSITGAQTGITITPAGASTFLMTGFPSPDTAGTGQSVTVTALDPYGNVATGYSGTVQVTSSDPKAILPSAYTFAAVDAGTHSFAVTLETAGSQSITATDTVNGSITDSQTNITVNAAGASVLVVSGFPSPTTAGTAQSFTVTAEDPFGNIANGYTGTVQLSSTDASAVLPGPYTFTASDAGVHTFSGQLRTAAVQSITAADTVTSSIMGTQAGISVTPAATSAFAITGFTPPVIVGTASQFKVRAVDAYGNVTPSYTGTVHFTSSDTKAALPANYAFFASDAGQHSFSATLKTSGNQTVTATDTVSSAIAGQTTVAVAAAVAKSLALTNVASPVVAGTAHTFSLSAKDAYGNIATTYTGTVTFTSSDTQAIVPVNYTFTAADAGIHVITNGLTLETVGSQSLTATDTVNSTLKATHSGITVTAAAAASFTFVGLPATMTAGVAQPFTLKALDAYGNLATGYRGTVHFTSSDTKAVLPANYAFTTADAGQHTYSVTLKTAGSKTITATDTKTPATTGQASVTVVAAAASTLAITNLSSPVVAGTAHSFTLTAKDAFGNVATGYTGTVAFTSSDAQAVLPANYTFTLTDAGLHVFTNLVKFKTAGTQSLTATDTVTSAITGTRTGVQVLPAAAKSLVVSGFPSAIAAGTAGSFTVTVVDVYGNTVTGYTGTIHFTSSDLAASLPANYTFVAGDAGVHTFSATFNTSGTQSLTATDTVNGTIKGSQTGIQVSDASTPRPAIDFEDEETSGAFEPLGGEVMEEVGASLTERIHLGDHLFADVSKESLMPITASLANVNEAILAAAIACLSLPQENLLANTRRKVLSSSASELSLTRGQRLGS